MKGILFFTLIHLATCWPDWEAVFLPITRFFERPVCNSTLEVPTCPFNTMCAACLPTSLQYSKDRSQAEVVCGKHSERRYVRLIHDEPYLEPLTLRASNLKKLKCSRNGWIYHHRMRNYRISSVSCFYIPSSVQQSPIDFEKPSVTYDPSLRNGSINFDYKIGDIYEMEVSPDSHGFQMHTDPDNFKFMRSRQHSTLTAAHLDVPFQLFSVHAHWSDPQNRTHMGSEHKVFGKKRPAEIHLVFWNPKYQQYSYAQGRPDGIAVLGVFVEVGAPNQEFGKITDVIRRHLPVNETIIIGRNDLNNIDLRQLLPENKDFFKYTGYLTTPNYSSCVEWTVFNSSITISQEQLEVLMQLYNGGNDRDTQKICSPVKSSFVL